jgi:hypothetical protein
MLKWLLTLLLALVILSVAAPWVRGRLPGRFALGRLPGDFRIPLRGRVYYVPFASTVLLTILVWAIGRIL